MKNEICTLILAMIMCYTHAHSHSLKLNLTVNYHEDEDYDLYHLSVLFYKNSYLTRFKDCLCNKSSRKCNLDLSSMTHERFTVATVEGIEEEMTFSWLQDWYLNHYFCEFQKFYPQNVFCSRLKSEFKTVLLPNHFYTGTSNCDLTCVQISWKNALNVELSNNDMFVVNGGDLAPVCLSTTSTTVKATRATANVKSTSQKTTIKVSASPVQQSSHKDNTTNISEITTSVTKKLDSHIEDSNNTSIVVGVVMAVVVILAIVTGAVVVFYRRRQHTKSNNDANDHSRSGTETISIALKSVRNKIQSRLKFSKGDRKNMNGQRDEVELSHQMQGYSTIDYTNPQNLPEDNIGMGDQSNLNETNMQNYVNYLSDPFNGIYNNSLTDSEFACSVLEYSTIDLTPQNNGQLKGVDNNNTYSNCGKPPTSLKDQDPTKIMQDSSSPNYELATSINRSVSDNIRGKTETLASNPPVGEYSRLGEKSRDIKNPYNTLPDTDDSRTLALAHRRSRLEIEEPIASKSSDNALTKIFSCHNDYSEAVYDGKSRAEFGPSEYELATE
ncbi:unnamed protein product [Lymnaea stagnalis]|uniref:Uncharacterized protein n=1 Tax=Lymnaea stagnalis TaxID=6523 RepID=A0AAV2H4H9_LYMST